MPRNTARPRLIVGISGASGAVYGARLLELLHSLSVETPYSAASRSANSLLSLPKAVISVGQTKVKSFGQAKSTSHLPAKLCSLAG